MTQGQIVELILKDGDRAVGYYQYTENRVVFLSPFSHGLSQWGTLKSDILKIVEL